MADRWHRRILILALTGLVTFWTLVVLSVFLLSR